jgi:hypothetical protein
MGTKPSSNSPILTPELLAHFERLRVAWQVPGFAIGVVRLDSEIETYGFGIANTAGDKVTPDVRVFSRIKSSLP